MNIQIYTKRDIVTIAIFSNESSICMFGGASARCESQMDTKQCDIIEESRLDKINNYIKIHGKIKSREYFN